MMLNRRLWNASLVAIALSVVVNPASGSTVAYWRFEGGTTGADVTHIAGADNTFSADILDVSGNGNHLSTWNTGGCCGYAYRDSVASSHVPQTGQPNNLSVKNTGGGPGMFTNSTVSMPVVDIDAFTPLAFTVEASVKGENGGHRTYVGRDAQNVGGNAGLAALYLQARPDNSVGILFNDVAGNTHEAFTPAGFFQGYDFPTDPEGLNAPWYHLAGVSDGATLKLYVDGNLITSTPIVSADARLAVGTTSGGDWHAGGWSVGRGLFNGGHTDRGYGFIDEVRISDAALSRAELLAVPEPATAALALVAMAACGLAAPARRSLTAKETT
jgi:hypothetical protein